MADNRPVIANLDFDDVKQDLVSFFKNRSEFSDYDFTGSGLNLLMDVLAYNTHYNALAANFLVNEMFLESAALRKNVVSIAKTLNYTPRSARAASTDITISIPKVGGANFYTLPAGTLFSATSGSTTYNFYTIEDYTIQYDATDANGTFKNIEVEAYEGAFITQRFQVGSADALNAFMSFDLTDTNIDTSSLTVTVNDAKHAQVSPAQQGITSLNKNSAIYFLEEIDGLKYRLKFGNGTIGKKPEVNDVILATYLKTNGAEGNGISSFTITVPGRSDVLIVSNTIAAGGGAAETIQEVKDNAPNWFQSQFRAVTAKDYETILKKDYADIQSVNVYGGEDVGQPGKVFFTIKPKNRDKLTEQEKLTISNDILKKYNLITVRPVIEDPRVLKIIAKTIIQYDQEKLTTTPGVLVARAQSLYNTLNTSYIGDFLESFQVSKLASEIVDLDNAIVSANTRINLRYDINVVGGQIDTPDFSFNNRLHEVIYAGEDSVGAVVQSTEFTRLGSQVKSQFVDDGKGTLRLVDIVDGEAVIVNANAGTVDYKTGEVSIIDFAAEDGGIGFIGVPESFDINASDNYLLQISLGDSTARAIDKNDIDALNRFNVSRAK